AATGVQRRDRCHLPVAGVRSRRRTGRPAAGARISASGVDRPGAADRFPRLALYRAAGAGLLAGISDVRAALSALAALVERAVRRDLPRGGPAQPAGHHHRADYRLRAVAGAAATGAPARALANV